MKIRRLALVLVILISAVPLWGRSLYEHDLLKLNYKEGDPPYLTIAVHNVGRMALTMSNFGVFGLSGGGNDLDPLTGEPAPSLAYPKGFEANYLYEASLWVGAIVGHDTLVSTSSEDGWMAVREFFPLPYPEGDISFRTINDRYDSLYDSAVSQQDFVAIYTDTIDDIDLTGYDYFTGRGHRPLNIQVTQKSYAWGYDYAEDFIIVDMQIANIDLKPLENIYIGLYVDNDCGRTNNANYPYDDVCGFKKTLRSRYIAGLIDTIDVVWAADNDGDPDPYSGDYAGYNAPTSAIGLKVLRTPSDEPKFNFNWWVSSWYAENDWGPRKNEPGGVRTFQGRLGTPLSDEDRYYVMANGEFDYDQATAYYDRSLEGWLPPPANAYSISYGADIRYLISCGPFDLEPGDALPFTFAFVAGEDFYDDGGVSGEHTFRDFINLQLNTLWASWIFDNPGVDTDGNGYRGKYHIFCGNPKIAYIDTIIIQPGDTVFDTTMRCTFADTIFYTGDGVPDFRGAAPPASPNIRLFPRIDEYNHGEITIRWNGHKSETEPDQFSQKIDFEGYRIYISRSGQSNDFTLVTSFDKENYDRYEYDVDLHSWVIVNPPYDMRLLRNMYGDDFDPELYFNEENLFNFYNTRLSRWESYFFTRHDWNESDLKDTTKIHKIYPDQPYPSTLNLDSARMFYPDEVTEDGQLKYYEYRYVLRNLLPSIPHYVAVTAFDHGFPGADLLPLETKPAESAVREFAQNNSDLVVENDLQVIVYPNPYRVDENYRRFYEGWEEPDKIPDRTRALHFTNLPHQCMIRIFTIDGDLVAEVPHYFEKGSPGSMHETWNLVSRNDMKITSGIYYYVVESDYGTQVGKFVVIY